MSTRTSVKIGQQLPMPSREYDQQNQHRIRRTVELNFQEVYADLLRAEARIAELELAWTFKHLGKRYNDMEIDWTQAYNQAISAGASFNVNVSQASDVAGRRYTLWLFNDSGGPLTITILGVDIWETGSSGVENISDGNMSKLELWVGRDEPDGENFISGWWQLENEVVP